MPFMAVGDGIGRCGCELTDYTYGAGWVYISSVDCRNGLSVAHEFHLVAAGYIASMIEH